MFSLHHTSLIFGTICISGPEQSLPHDLDAQAGPQILIMTFFGKLKNLNAGPPAPPRRPANNSGFDWPQDEFTDDEEGDMYEAPPCERPPVKVPQIQAQDNIYLETTPNPAISMREAAPPPPQQPKNQKRQLRQDLLNDMKKPPEVDRNEKPGRTKMMPPPSAPMSESIDEDVYLDPNAEPEENDDLYLEPEAACPSAPRAPMRKPASLLTATVPTLIRAKPPIPGGKSSSMFPPVIDRKTGGMRMDKPLRYEDKEWFAGDCTRKTAEDFLERVNKDGAFLIRRSSDQRTCQPFTLAVLYQQKVYNIPIRFLEDVQGYALGKEGKKNEETFSSLDEMISHHKKNKLLLIDSKSHAKNSVHLTYPVCP